MSLLDKFAVVEIKVDARISEQDKQFCERQQAAYTAALHGFQELIFFWEDMLLAIGRSDEMAASALRLSLSVDNTQADVDEVLRVVSRLVKELRRKRTVKVWGNK